MIRLDHLESLVIWRPILEFNKSPHNTKGYLFAWFKKPKNGAAFKAYGFYAHEYSQGKHFCVNVGMGSEDGPTHFFDIDEFDL